MSRNNRLVHFVGIAGCTLLVGATLASGAGYITSVTDVNSEPAITNGVTSQRENDLGGTIVPFGEDVFCFTDRNHQYNGVRFTAAGVLTNAATPAADDVIVGLPSYLLGGEYVSTRNNNRTKTPFQLNVTVTLDQDVLAYLLIDNRVGDATANWTDPPTLGQGATPKMQWVIDDGWKIMNTGISPNGQPDFGAIDEGGSITDFLARPNANSNLGVGPGVLVNNAFSIYRKGFKAGSTIVLKEQNAGNLNMYGLVVTPEPATMGLLALGALALVARRRRH